TRYRLLERRHHRRTTTRRTEGCAKRIHRRPGHVAQSRRTPLLTKVSGLHKRKKTLTGQRVRAHTDKGYEVAARVTASLPKMQSFWIGAERRISRSRHHLPHPHPQPPPQPQE